MTDDADQIFADRIRSKFRGKAPQGRDESRGEINIDVDRVFAERLLAQSNRKSQERSRERETDDRRQERSDRRRS